MDWNRLADEKTLENTSKNLKDRGIEVMVVDTKDDARRKVLGLIPEGAEVMESSSTTLDEIGVSSEIDNSGRYKSIRKVLYSTNEKEERDELRRKSLSPEYGIGSVHAVTEDGQVVVASASGSQIAPYAYGAANLIWVVGTQKIVRNLDEAFKRIYEHALPLESERMRKAYGAPGSSVNKLLIFEREREKRIRLIFVRERLGF